MLPHELAQKHSEDMEKVARFTCVIDSTGFVRNYNGYKYCQKLEELGHSSTDPMKCKCGAKSHYLSK